MPIDDEGLADNVGPSAETVLPIGMRQNGDEVAADDTIILGSNQTAEGGFQAEHGKVAAGNEHAGTAHRLALEREIGAKAEMRRDAGERPLLALEVAKHGMAEDLLAAAGVVTRLAPRLRPGSGEIHELLGGRDR